MGEDVYAVAAEEVHRDLVGEELRAPDGWRVGGCGDQQVHRGVVPLPARIIGRAMTSPVPTPVPARYAVLDVEVDEVGPEAAIEVIGGWVERRERNYVCFANVHGVMEAHHDPAVREAYRAARLVVADGMPLVWVGRALGREHVRRVYGPDLTLALCALAARAGHRCYFFGGGAGVAEALAAAMAQRFPGLRVAGVESPPFRTSTPEEDEDLVRRINAAKPDIVFVGLGCPKQERWMARHRPRLAAAVLVGVGAAFDFHTGRVKQAPRWMMRTGLEWLFRLAQEPRRLWRRYLVNNPVFVLLVIRQLLGRRAHRPVIRA
jgi:N-acetylglucosaminyldiphosphoundecaprenol N-acetyl-beta-D-mannosaminyltransferase